jgi:Nucleoside 2-deoxyribosyltransferase
MKVYLSGPITGLDFNTAHSWTEYAKQQLRILDSEHIGHFRIDGYKPLRKKSFLANETELSAHGYNHHPLSSNRGIVTRDIYDVRSSDMILVNLLDAKRVSIGTVCEISAAFVLNIPIVLVMEKEGNVHEHCFVREMCDYHVHDLDFGISLVKSVLLP